MDNYEEFYKISDLIVKHLRQELADREVEVLESWRKADPENERLFLQLTSGQNLLDELPVYCTGDKEPAIQRMLDRINKPTKRHFSFTYKRYIGYAAAVVLLAAVSYFVFPFKTSLVHTPEIVANDLPPGGNRAILILDGGQKIDLDNADTGEIARQGAAVISKSEEGYIAYNLTHTDLTRRGDGVTFNTISTPRGGQYRLQLPDGSRVWLNAHSSLKFPTWFGNKERRVELTGEAFFEVVHSGDRPFYVVSRSQTVEVLGTEFNVNGYADEKNITTTLLTGKVKIKLNSEGSGSTVADNVTLSPGQKSLVENQSYDIRVTEADIEESIAWKNGQFRFNDTDLGTIMRQIARWYDVEVEYKGNVADLRFRGKIPRHVPASQVFEILKTSGINIMTEGRKITVSN